MYNIEVLDLNFPVPADQPHTAAVSAKSSLCSKHATSTKYTLIAAETYSSQTPCKNEKKFLHILCLRHATSEMH